MTADVTATVTVTVKNRLGLHARPAMSLAELASVYEADVQVRRHDQDRSVDAKSTMQLMMLAATSGTKLEITARGADAEQAVADIQRLVERDFDES